MQEITITPNLPSIRKVRTACNIIAVVAILLWIYTAYILFPGSRDVYSAAVSDPSLYQQLITAALFGLEVETIAVIALLVDLVVIIRYATSQKAVIGDDTIIFTVFPRWGWRRRIHVPLQGISNITLRYRWPPLFWRGWPSLIFQGQRTVEVPLIFWSKKDVAEVIAAIQHKIKNISISQELAEYLKH